MASQCDVCFENFDLDLHRPKSLPCGHTLCKECVQNPTLGGFCPTCRKDLAVIPGNHPDNHPDNISLIRQIEEGNKRALVRKETRLQQLERGVAAGRKLLQELRHLVPVAVEALNHHLESTAAQLRQLEEALEHEAAGDVGRMPDWPDLVVEPQKLVAQLEESLHLLTNTKCSVVVEQGGDTCRTSVQPGQFGNILHLLLLQLRAAGLLEKVGDVAVSAAPAGFVGPPVISTLSIEKEDLDENGGLKVKDILQDTGRWKNIRSLRNLRGGGSVRLLRVVAPHLEELEMAGEVGVDLMEEVKKLPSLRRLKVKCTEGLESFPNLPLGLEELSIEEPSEQQLRCVQRMPRLRSLAFWDYEGPDVAFPPAQQGGLLWLQVALNMGHKVTLMSLIRAHASSLQELQLFSPVNDKDKLNPTFYFPELGQDLAACNLQALRRLAFCRLPVTPCEEVDACLLQRRTIQGFLAPSVDVICLACHRSVF